MWRSIRAEKRSCSPRLLSFSVCHNASTSFAAGTANSPVRALLQGCYIVSVEFHAVKLGPKLLCDLQYHFIAVGGDLVVLQDREFLALEA